MTSYIIHHTPSDRHVDMDVSDRERVLGQLRDWMDSAEPTDSNRLRAAELLGRASGLFATEVNVNTRERDATEVAAELEQRLAGILSAVEPEADVH